MQALYWHPVCESVLTLSLITPGWELDPSQHAGGWPLLSLQEAGPLSACCLVATGQHQCHHFIITQADSWTSLSKQEALSQSALHLHFNPTARLKEGPLSPDLWNGDICGRAMTSSSTRRINFWSLFSFFRKAKSGASNSPRIDTIYS